MTDKPNLTPDTPPACDLCGVAQANWRQRTYPYWQRYECGRRYSVELATWSYGDTAECLRRQLVADRKRLEALERFHRASDVVEMGVLDFDLRHAAVVELDEAHRAIHPAALATGEETK
jgi:hypothetical protein